MAAKEAVRAPSANTAGSTTPSVDGLYFSLECSAILKEVNDGITEVVGHSIHHLFTIDLKSRQYAIFADGWKPDRFRPIYSYDANAIILENEQMNIYNPSCGNRIMQLERHTGTFSHILYNQCLKTGFLEEGTCSRVQLRPFPKPKF
jgi:hypothetical protein